MNLIEPSLNYGWPAITYGIDYSGAVISPFTEKEGMEQPLFHWTPSIAPSDMIFYEANGFSWIQEGIRIMEENPDVLCVLPKGGPPTNDGSLNQGTTPLSKR